MSGLEGHGKELAHSLQEEFQLAQGRVIGISVKTPKETALKEKTFMWMGKVEFIFLNLFLNF